MVFGKIRQMQKERMQRDIQRKGQILKEEAELATLRERRAGLEKSIAEKRNMGRARTQSGAVASLKKTFKGIASSPGAQQIADDLFGPSPKRRKKGNKR